MGQGILAMLATELAATGVPAAAIARTLEIRTDDVETVVVLDTLEYLRKGGRISGPQAAIGTLLSVKPIIAIKDGVVETADKPGPARRRARAASSSSPQRPVERVAILHTMAPTSRPSAMSCCRTPGGIDPSAVSVELVGPSVGPHLGPGAVGAAVSTALTDARGSRSTAPNGTMDGVATGSATLRNGGRDARRGPPAILPGLRTTRRADRPIRAARAPWGRPGDDPAPPEPHGTGGRTEVPSLHDHRAGRCADQSVGRSHSSSSTWPPIA